MKLKLILFLTSLISTSIFGQKIDTIKFYSQAFDSERAIYISTPEFYKYQSQEVRLPVIYILDGQHEWFVNPLLNTIKYLQYTHQVPQAIIVTIPLVNRNKECSIQSLTDSELPLQKFITKEVDEQIKQYHPNSYKIIIGHSFSASFALYAYFKNPTYYSGIIANTPKDSFKEFILAFEKNKQIDKSRISISIGGKAENEDFYHRKTFDTLKSQFPLFFKSINTFIADNARHTAVPIVANPFLLTKLFSKFNDRYSKIAQVNLDNKLIIKPKSIDEEIIKLKQNSLLGNYFYPPEIPDLNGIASRYWNSGYEDYALKVYELGIEYYPNYYEFYLSLYELSISKDKEKAKKFLNKATLLLNTVDFNLAEKAKILNEIEIENSKNGW